MMKRAVTPIQQYIEKQLFHLSRGDFEGKRGTNSHVIVGPKGCGRASFLDGSGNLQAFSNVIPVYIDFGVIRKSAGSHLAVTPMARLILRELEERGIRSSSGLGEGASEKSLHALRESGKYMFLLIDNLDELHRQCREMAVSRSLYRTNMDDLAYLGNQESGRVLTVVACGAPFPLDAPGPFSLDLDLDRYTHTRK